MRNKEKKRTHIKSSLGGIFFYLTLIGIIVAVFFLTRDQEAGVPRHMAGFSAMRVLTGSMQSEIPRHSLIITKQVDPREIQVGDDITFMVSETTTMTHRVILIYEDYRDTGQRGFQTQGIENPSPDWEIVRPENIVGRVVWHNVFFGQVLHFIGEHVLVVGIFVALLIAFIGTMRIVFRRKGSLEESGEIAKETSIMEEMEQEDSIEINRIKEEMIALLKAD
ncbi:MAG: signal peptidase I [Lachnospiraceae bacterium]|nr:signal peptidase I [Lachnospiraceae bacterium]